jgi:hypothetical protein
MRTSRPTFKSQPDIALAGLKCGLFPGEGKVKACAPGDKFIRPRIGRGFETKRRCGEDSSGIRRGSRGQRAADAAQKRNTNAYFHDETIMVSTHPVNIRLTKKCAKDEFTVMRPSG